MEPEEVWMLQRMLVKRGLEPIKSAIRSGELTEDQALAMFAQDGGLQNDPKLPDFQKFMNNSGLIYANEQFFPSSFQFDYGLNYRFGLPSQNDVHMLFKLYQHMGGKEYYYENPEQLKEAVSQLVSGKRILELGCGPGFNLKVLQDLGAKVSGVELRPELAGKLDVDVKVADAVDLGQMFEDNEFDLIYSRDFFCNAMLKRDASKRIITATYRKTKDKGLGIHQFAYRKIQMPLFLLNMWIQCRNQGEEFAAEVENNYWNLSAEERENAHYTNHSSLDVEDILVRGFRIRECSIENNEFNLVVQK